LPLARFANESNSLTSFCYGSKWSVGNAHPTGYWRNYYCGQCPAYWRDYYQKCKVYSIAGNVPAIPAPVTTEDQFISLSRKAVSPNPFAVIG
jgi:hypothetical protein